MSFMSPVITERCLWYEIEDHRGETTFVPQEHFCASDVVPQNVDDQVSIKLVLGYGARLSAAGYTDCTEWAVYETAADAADDLLSMYYDGADDEMTDDERSERDDLRQVVLQG